MNYDSILCEDFEDEVKAMTLGEILEVLESGGSKNVVFMGAEQYTIGELMSWRGSYSLPALSYEYATKTADELYAQITDELKLTHHGYKGGEYKYTKDDAPYVAEYGRGQEFCIVDIKEEGGDLVLYTKIIPY